MSHPAVLETAIIGIPDSEWGEKVLGIVVLKPNEAATEDEIRQHCRNLIAGYKVPKHIEFIDALPKSGAGKLLKKDLRSDYWKDFERGVS
jgi:acyl-CoA synthetase (AMP-forming)/AMP-acid ligase II